MTGLSVKDGDEETKTDMSKNASEPIIEASLDESIEKGKAPE